MPTDKKKLVIVASFEDASILRKFTILFLISSIVPMGLLYLIYIQNKTMGRIDFSLGEFTIAMSLMAIGVLVGFFSMRALLTKMITISLSNRKAMENFLSPETIKEIDQEKNELVMLSRSFSAITDKLEENIRNLEAAKKTLHSVMSKVGEGISNMGNINSFLQLIVETTTSALNGKVGTLMILNKEQNELIIQTVYGTDYQEKNPIHIQLSNQTAFAKIIADKRPAMITDFTTKHVDSKAHAFFANPMLCAPLVYQEKVNGLITLTKPPSEKFTDEDLTLLYNLASQTAVAYENSQLNHDIEKTYFETISALALAVDAKDKYSRGHLDRVTEYALIIGHQLKLSDKDLNTLRDGARLHDLGKIGIPDDVLKKEGTLTDEEWILMRRHPEIGESIIKPVRSLEHICDIVRHHHEKLDGTGYPDKLKDQEISPLVRIIAVADVYDALTTHRPYRPKKSIEEASEILRSMKNHLDQRLVEILLERIKN